MPLVQSLLMRLAQGVTVTVSSDELSGLVHSLLVDNPSPKPASVTFTVDAASGNHLVSAGLMGVVLPAPTAVSLGASVSIAAVL